MSAHANSSLDITCKICKQMLERRVALLLLCEACVVVHVCIGARDLRTLVYSEQQQGLSRTC